MARINTFLNRKGESLLFLFISAACLWSAPLVAETTTYTLAPAKSRAAFQLTSFLLNTRGKFLKYGGTFTLKDGNISRSILNLTLDGSQVALDGPSPNQDMLLSTLLRSNTNSRINFASTTIQPVSGGRYLVAGTSTAGKHREAIRGIPASIVRTKDGIEIVGTYRYAGPIGNPDSPQSQMVGEVDGTAQFKLTFLPSEKVS